MCKIYMFAVAFCNFISMNLYMILTLKLDQSKLCPQFYYWQYTIRFNYFLPWKVPYFCVFLHLFKEFLVFSFFFSPFYGFSVPHTDFQYFFLVQRLKWKFNVSNCIHLTCKQESTREIHFSFVVEYFIGYLVAFSVKVYFFYTCAFEHNMKSLSLGLFPRKLCAFSFLFFIFWLERKYFVLS